MATKTFQPTLTEGSYKGNTVITLQYAEGEKPNKFNSITMGLKKWQTIIENIKDIKELVNKLS